MYNIIAVIHARGGSQRIPLKNIALLGGKPLISYCIKACLGSEYLQRVIVSTDHEGIKKAALEAGAEVPFVRPPHLSTDCPSELVTIHAADFVEEQDKKPLDIIVTIQPTTPFIRSQDIDSCIKLVIDGVADTAFTGNIVRERPEWMFEIMEVGKVSPFIKGEMQGERGVYQSLPKLITPNGGAYATKRAVLFTEQVIIKATSVACHVMPLEYSIDIDEPVDLSFANFLISQKS